MNPAWCSSCLGDDDRAFPGLNGSGTRAGVSEQEQVDRLCRQLGLPSQAVGEGVELPLDVFEQAAVRCGVKVGTVPAMGRALARQAGIPWGAACHNRATETSGGPTVTREGLDVINRAVTQILAHA
jgi:hypothetical protein